MPEIRNRLAPTGPPPVPLPIPPTRCPLGDDWGALIQQVKDASDIADVISGYVSLRPVGPVFKGLCPFHDDHRPSFDVDPRRQRYRCWSCQKHGDVFTFIQEHDRVDFREALELLARRAGITLKKIGVSPQKAERALMLDVVRWAAEQFQRCLLDSPLAESARRYLGERRLAGEIVRRFGLGFAPPNGDWLVQLASRAGLSLDLLEQVGLVAHRQDGMGHYDRFRDRLQFPIRDARGQTVGFGGRILPSSPMAQRDGVPKYYNSAETPLFNKSEQLYGIDQARQAGAKAGYLAVVEGYTDVLMAHQLGVCQVVATMGTALNAKHVQQLRRFVPRVVLVFDADEGGDTGVDRALEIFSSQEVDLKIATLPSGLDPCDLLVQQGAEPFVAALENAVDALEFKLNQVWPAGKELSLDERRAGMDAILRIVAAAADAAGQTGAVQRELMISRIAKRLALKEETIWTRLRELQRTRRPVVARGREEEPAAPRSGPAAAEERELLTVLLADPGLVSVAKRDIDAAEVMHPGLRRLLEGLYSLDAEGQSPTLDLLRAQIDEPRMIALALDWQEAGRANGDRTGWLQKIVEEFRRRRQVAPRNEELKNRLHGASDHATALDLLRRLQSPN
jgi:DNA primase